MKQSTKVVLSLLLVSGAGNLLADTAATPYFNARSQSANIALEMVGQEKYINRMNAVDNYSVLSLTPGYQQSFREGDIACCLFGQDIVKSGDCAKLNISGSGVTSRGAKDWLADYFGLPTDYKSTISFSPRISSVFVDAQFYMGLDNWKEGMYFRMHIPFVHTRWRLDACEGSVTEGTTAHPFGYFTGNNPTAGGLDETNNLGNARSELLTRALQFLSLGKVPSLSNVLYYTNSTSENFYNSAASSPYPCGLAGADLTNIAYNDGIVFEALENARWACDTLTKNGVGEWRFTLGYNAYSNDKYHVGFGVTGAAPTGNRPHGKYLLEPIIGNGNHWELGAQITSHYCFWKSEDEERSFTGYLDANLTHMFKVRQTRSFDLKGKPNSRYMLAQKLGEPCYLYNALVQRCVNAISTQGADAVTTTAVTPTSSVTNTGIATASANVQYAGALTSGLTEASAQFKNHYAPVANLTTVDVDVNIGAQIDLGLMFNYTHCNWSIDLGYNLWARTCERIKLNCDCPTRLADGNTWALKGTAQVYGVNIGCSNIVVDSNDIADFLHAGYNVSAGNINPYALGATQSKANIHGGATAVTATPTPAPTLAYKNNTVDSPRFAVAAVDVELCVLNETANTLSNVTTRQERSGKQTVYTPLYQNRRSDTETTGNNANSRVMNSKNPVYITENDLDLEGASTKGLSHKIFGHVSYQWTNKDDYTPFLGLGASGEFVNNSGDCCPSSCSSSSASSSNSCKTSCGSDDLSCKRCGLSQWAVWVKGGISFN